MAKFAKSSALLILFFGIFSSSQSAATIESLMADPLIVQKEIDCVMGRRPCDILGNSLKDSLIEVLANECRHCTPHQMINAIKIMEFMEKNHPTEWEAIVKMYQPQPQSRNFHGMQ